MANILLAEDDLTFVRILVGFLNKNGHHVDITANVKEAVRALNSRVYDLTILDYRLPDGTGLDILETIKLQGWKIPVIIMTSFIDIRTAVKSIRSGAIDYITKPVNPEELLMVLNEILSGKKDASLHAKNTGPHFVKGTSDASKQLYEHIGLIAPTEMSVILEGETGTGKEHVARFIHQQSKRVSGPFVAIDCGALSDNMAVSELFGHVKGAFTGAVADKKGQFEVAEGGTLFLDEVGNLSYEIQVKLLRAIQEGVIQPLGSTRQVKTNVRIITATNDDLLASVQKGFFREDLYHRLNEFKIQVPPLRSRVGELSIFTAHFINEANRELGKNVKCLSDDVLTIFYKYDWPGNLRQLKNVIKRMVLLTRSEVAGKDALPEEMILTVNTLPRADGTDLKAAHEATEKELIRKTLHQVKYNKTKAAQLLNIDRKTLYYKMARYGIE